MEHDAIDWERLDRYVTGRGTPEELAALERWVDSDPALRALADAMRSAGLPPHTLPPDWDAGEAWQRVSGRMRLMERGPLRVIPGAGGARGSAAPPSPRRLARAWRSVAAAAAVVLAVGSVLMFSRHDPEPDVAVAGAVEMQEFTTGPRQRSVLDLPDGSRVMLAPASRLRVPVTYGARGARDLVLEGQAHFTVRRDTLRRFLVRTASGTAEALGTEFVVTAYAETRGMEVLLASGAVALHAAPVVPEPEMAAAAAVVPPLLTLAPGDLAHLDPAGVATLTSGVDVDARMAWTTGRIVFDGTRLGDAVPIMERWYDIEIRLADSALAGRRLTATFHGDPLPQVLELLAMSLDLDVQWRDGLVVLSMKSPGGSRR